MAIYAVSFTAYPVLQLVSGLKGASTPLMVATGAVEVIGKAEVADSTPVWGIILILAFIIGMAMIAIRTVITCVRLIRVIRSGQKIEHNGYTLVVTDDERFAPFSWMR